MPYVEEQGLYATIDFAKPWDDPVNAVACQTAVGVYRCPESKRPLNYTTYLAVAGQASCFLPDASRRVDEITDSKSETLMVVEAGFDHAVPWMCPIDAENNIVFDVGPQSELAHAGGFQVAFADGSVRYIDANISQAQRRAFISIAGGDDAIAREAGAD